MGNIENYINQIPDSAVSALARSYNVLDYSHRLQEILSAIMPENDFRSYSKLQLHHAINEILSTRYNGENKMKAKLVEMFREKDVTAAFEIRVNGSRADFLTINGDTKSYEIKSSIDNLSKLAKQVSDYERVFEFNYIVVDEKHLIGATDLIPENYGIYILANEKIVRKRTANKNSFLEAEMQLNLFTKKELAQQFKGVGNTVSEVLNHCSQSEINTSFKKMLKKRYELKWSFLKQNMNEILPIDYQFFFHHNIAPKVIYDA